MTATSTRSLPSPRYLELPFPVPLRELLTDSRLGSRFGALIQACRSACAALILVLASHGAGAADVLTQHNDNARTGVNAGETILTTGNVKPDNFGRLWTLYVDGQISAQPLYVSQLRIDTSTNPNAPLVQGTFNVVVVATMHNTVYVYDADAENRLPDGNTKPLWAAWLGQPRASGADIDMWGTNDPEWGILSTPVVDAQKTTLWVVTWNEEGGTKRYRLHALNLKDGSPRRAPIVIGGVPPDPNQPCAYPTSYNPCKQKQRAALLLDRGIVYVAFGGDGSRGALFAFDAATLQQVAFWSPTPTGDNGGIWQSGRGPAADADGNVYLMTANGDVRRQHPRRTQLRRELRQAPDRERRLRGEGLLHAMQSAIPVEHRPRSGFERAGADPGHQSAFRGRKGGHHLSAFAHQHGPICGKPDGTQLQEPECRAGVSGDRDAPLWRWHLVGPYAWYAGVLEGT